ncbi:MAG: gephyrin-like molybdotransferase Glp, partial [bacterium]
MAKSIDELTLNNDPRGCGFRHRTTVEAFVSIIHSSITRIDSERISPRIALGRVLSETLFAPVDIPSFNRAAMDGFALKAEETFGSDLYTPSRFNLIGRSRPGIGFSATVGPAEAVAIATGAPVPAGADCVVPVEFTEMAGNQIIVRSPVTPGRHIGKVAEDVQSGTPVIPAGQVLRPQDIGLCAGLGVQSVSVIKKPRIAIIATGDELNANPDNSLKSNYQINDMNSPMLSALFSRDGGEPILIGPIQDDALKLKSTLLELANCNDIHGIIINGGSSAGPEDHAPAIISDTGKLLVHGVALRPASPTGFGLIGLKPVLLTPGNPVSCLCAYDLFGRLIVRKLAGLATASPYPVVKCKLAHKLSSVIGRVDYVRVKWKSNTNEVEVIATSGASILSGATRATGFIIIPASLEGFPAGAEVPVHCYDTF